MAATCFHLQEYSYAIRNDCCRYGWYVVYISPALAQNANEHASHHFVQTQAAAPGAALNEGEVRKVDREAGRISLKHGPITNLGMPPMTMMFKARDAAMLEQLKAGDKVRFAVELVGGQYTVTRVERVQ